MEPSRAEWRPGRAEKPGEVEWGGVGPSEAESVAWNRTDAEASLTSGRRPKRGRRIGVTWGLHTGCMELGCYSGVFGFFVG